MVVVVLDSFLGVAEPRRSCLQYRDMVEYIFGQCEKSMQENAGKGFACNAQECDAAVVTAVLSIYLLKDCDYVCIAEVTWDSLGFPYFKEQLH